jgi:hypothetical protein
MNKYFDVIIYLHPQKGKILRFLNQNFCAEGLCLDL